jgi:hypothetical protein
MKTSRMNTGLDFIPQRLFILNIHRPKKFTAKSNKHCKVYLEHHLSYSLRVQVCISKGKINGAILRTWARQNMCEQLFITESGDARKIYTTQLLMEIYLHMQTDTIHKVSQSK